MTLTDNFDERAGLKQDELRSQQNGGNINKADLIVFERLGS
jgi:hypothetical protein